MIRLLLADDHPVIRGGLRQMLQSDGSMNVTSEAATLAEVLDMSLQNNHDAIVLDLVFPDGIALEAIRQIRARPGSAPIIVFSNQTEAAPRALDRGAYAFVPKDADVRELRRAIHAAVEGKPFVGSHIDPVTSGDPDAPHHKLSKREREIMSRMIAGRRNKEIAYELEISEKTVATHRARLLSKLGLENLRELLLYAVRHGLADWI